MEKMHSTSTCAKAAGCSESYIRYAERIGVIAPQRDQTGRRLLTEADVEKIKTHRAARTQYAA